MMRIAIYHRYEYPNLKSRLKTYFMKLFGYFTLINNKIVFINCYGGEFWNTLVDVVIAEDERWRYKLEVIQAEWCKQVQVIIIKELKER